MKDIDVPEELTACVFTVKASVSHCLFMEEPIK
jgi:hypothetical protein